MDGGRSRSVYTWGVVVLYCRTYLIRLPLEEHVKTPIRTIRIPDPQWFALRDSAAARGSDASAVIRDLVAEWLRTPHNSDPAPLTAPKDHERP